MFTFPKSYDVLVIGAGHAGAEAAAAAARMGAQVALLTQNLDTIGQMSCNPAIGGLGKGHMVREIDALGGLMGENIDATGIQFRMLNRSKGPSVRAPRAQADKKAYQFRLKWLLESEPNIDIHQGNVAELLVENDEVRGVRTSLGMQLNSKTVVLSAGTFMRGLMHVGLKNEKGGRMGDATSTVSDSLKDLGFEVERFKTGTPCRLNGKSLNFEKCEKQEGDSDLPRFSFWESEKAEKNDIFTLNNWRDPQFHVEQVPCWITYTNSSTHNLIEENIDKSPMYCGVIKGTGPRYCPSIEDKVMRFRDKDRHQVFLEPEGRHSHEYYINGVSTSLPYEVQYDFIRSIEGLENAEIIRPGYAVEYDYCPPTQLSRTLETKKVSGLFFAGQINGTSGYEEAGAQGLMAGANAALRAQGKDGLVLSRSSSYIGVMIDDLVTKGVVEPYRMFTSRAEFRLLLRQDNADERLSPIGIETGLLGGRKASEFKQRARELEKLREFAKASKFENQRLDAWFRKTENRAETLPDEIKNGFHVEHWDRIETDFKFAGHIERQRQQVERMSRREDYLIPSDLDYEEISGLKREAKSSFAKAKPQTLGQAGRISGITPADVSILSIHLEKQKRLSSISKV